MKEYWREIKKEQNEEAQILKDQNIPRLLILNAGSRNHLIRSFLKTWKNKGEILVSDSYPLAPCLFENCRSFLIPHYTHKFYKETILDLCEKQNVTGIISLLDPDLSVLAEMQDSLIQAGVLAIISEKSIVDATFDKWEMTKIFEENDIPTVASWAMPQDFLKDLRLGKATFPVMVKPRQGSGSRGLNYVEDETTLMNVWERAKEPMLIQSWITGRELGADLYFDMKSGELISYFIKDKLKMRAGETDKSVSFENEEVEALLQDLSCKLALFGPIDVDLFITQNEEYLISEINPRFGGGYPHAYACGVDFPLLILKNLQGEQLTKQEKSWKAGHYMMKYFDMIFADSREIAKIGPEIK